jgi:hypothetical protein
MTPTQGGSRDVRAALRRLGGPLRRLLGIYRHTLLGDMTEEERNAP